MWKQAFDLPNTRGGQHIYEQQIEEGSGEEPLNNIQGNEKQIQNMREDPHEEIIGENHISDCNLGFIQVRQEQVDYVTLQIEEYSLEFQYYCN